MISIYVRVIGGLIVLAFCAWSYRLAMIMARENRRQKLNGSSGAVIRTIKRRLVIRMCKASMMVWSGWYTYQWLGVNGFHTIENIHPLFAAGSVTFAAFTVLMVMDTVLDVTDRRNNLELRKYEIARGDDH